jgi:hypothetical protein
MLVEDMEDILSPLSRSLWYSHNQFSNLTNICSTTQILTIYVDGIKQRALFQYYSLVKKPKLSTTFGLFLDFLTLLSRI